MIEYQPNIWIKGVKEVRFHSEDEAIVEFYKGHSFELQGQFLAFALDEDGKIKFNFRPYKTNGD